MDENKIRQCAQENGISAILHSVNRKYQIEIPDSLSRWLNGCYIESAGVHLLVETELSALGRAGDLPRVSLIKGAVFSRELYGDPALRPIADVDVVLAPEKEPEFLGLLKRFAYERVEENQHLYQKGSLRFDLHYDLFNTARIGSRKYLFPEFPPMALEKSLTWPGFYTLSASQHFAYLLFHNVKHSFLKWIWLTDTVLFAQKYFGGVSWGKLSAAVRPFQGQKLLAYNLDVIHGLLGIGESVSQKGFARKILFSVKNDDRQEESGPVLLGLMIRSRLHQLRYWFELIFPQREVLGEMFARPGVRVGHHYYFLRFFRLVFRAIRMGNCWLLRRTCGKKATKS